LLTVKNSDDDIGQRVANTYQLTPKLAERGGGVSEETHSRHRSGKKCPKLIKVGIYA
jgi:hypothetical protein